MVVIAENLGPAPVRQQQLPQLPERPRSGCAPPSDQGFLQHTAQEAGVRRTPQWLSLLKPLAQRLFDGSSFLDSQRPERLRRGGLPLSCSKGTSMKGKDDNLKQPQHLTHLVRVQQQLPALPEHPMA